MYPLFQGADSELWYHRKQKPTGGCPILMGVSNIQEKQQKFYFVTVNSNTPNDQLNLARRVTV